MQNRTLHEFLHRQLAAARGRAKLLSMTAEDAATLPPQLQRVQRRCDELRLAVSRTIDAIEHALADRAMTAEAA